MKMILQLLVLWLMASSWPWTGATTTTTSSSNAKPDCPERCGNVSVPYPFGFDHPNCAKDDNFLLTCNDSVSPPQLVFGSNIPVVEISVQNGTMSVSIQPAFDCYDKDGLSVGSFDQSITLGDGPFTFSDQRNKFTALGCDTLAFMEDSEGKLYGSGCVSLCDRPVNFTEQGSCSGVGCCQISIPKNLTTLNITLLSMNNYSDTWEFNPCGYAFLVDQNLFNFSNMNLSVYPKQMLDSRVVLDWVIGEETCESAQAHVVQAGYSCGPNTKCSDSTNGPGYRCLCKEGFLGNPYLRQGCQDIDECKEREKYPCHGSCKNTVGSYTCRCPLGMHGDGKVGCQGFRVTTIATVTGASILIGIILLLIFIECKKRKKEKYFRENGGSLLKHQRVRIFSEAELAKATNNYDDSQLLGRGGTGSVYKGVLVNDIQVAIKKPKEVNKLTQMNQQFQHEIGIVSQVNHKNVVKLMGLCLETKVPLLVYEFVSNGTLFQHIHEKSSTILRTWNDRLRIAAETALALDYLHSLADPPIIHRDVKSMNILLDEKCTAKVSDFGASILIPPGQTKIDMNIVGTFGYLDPEYLITGDLTVKSDVYSFGVVLMELLTGQKPTFTQNFITSIRNDSLPQILNVGLTSHEGEMEQIEAVTRLAKRCLSRSGDRRPTMKEVAEELIGLQKHIDNLWDQKNSEETESLLGESRYGFLENATGQITQSDTHYMTAFDIQQPSVSGI